MCKVYLAGPITGLVYKEASNWRKQAKEELEAAGIEAYDPLRGKEALAKKRKPIAVDSESDLDGALNTSRAIMTRDYQDCVNADALLVNFKGIEKISAGTVMEVAWAYHLRIPVVVIIDKDSFYLKHPMVKEAFDVIVDSVEEGIEAVCQLLLRK